MYDGIPAVHPDGLHRMCQHFGGIPQSRCSSPDNTPAPRPSKAVPSAQCARSFHSGNICGANLIRLRHERGISQRQLAKNMQIAGYDVDHHFIRRIENGERFVTDIELVALAKVLQVEITDLIDPAIPVAVQKD